LKLLGQINAMKVDVTANNIDDKKLMKQFSIFGPPTIVMISKKGNEIQSSRKIGVVNPDELIQEIEKLSL
jgi:thiol:disulfide interchange protein DsbD